jgi:hypothetical protein
MIDRHMWEAERVCRTNDRVLPRHLRQYLTTWAREGMSISSVWTELKNALAHGLPVEPLDNLIRRRHSEKVAADDARTKLQCPPLPESQRYVPHQWKRGSADTNWQGPSDE